MSCSSRLRFIWRTAASAPSRVKAPPAPDAAVQLVEIGLPPAFEQVSFALQHLLDQRIGVAIEAAIEQLSRIDEELVHGNAQPFGQAVQGAWVGRCGRRW